MAIPAQENALSGQADKKLAEQAAAEKEARKRVSGIPWSVVPSQIRGSQKHLGRYGGSRTTSMVQSVHEQPGIGQ